MARDKRTGRKVAHLTTVDLSLRYLVYPQLAAVRDRGDEAIGVSADGPDVAWLTERGVRHIALEGSTRGWSLSGDLRAMRSLWRILRVERPDVLHTHNPKPGLYGRVLGRVAGVPVVVNTVHGLYAAPDDPWPFRAVVYALESVASRFSDAELVQNPEDLELLTRWRISAPDKTVLLGNGVDLDRFHPPTGAERTAARRELGVDDGDVVIGFVGRLVAEKGLPELFDAVAALGPPFRLVVIGPDDPDKADALPADVLDRGRDAGVLFLGHRDDVDRLYHGFDVFCLPSHREGFPRSAMEASACGLPVVATDIRGCRQVVDDGVTGRLVPVLDATALADAIRGFADPVERRRAGEAARRRAESHFDEDEVVRGVLDAYDAGARRRFRRVRRTKRAVDVVGATAGLVVLSPVLASVAVAVKRRLGSPVLFRQTRPGHHGRPFELVKFRTMTDERGPDGELLPDDVRLTGFGQFLRSTSLDELPELWNVLRGDMSLVGPRPLLMEYRDRYTPEQARRHEVRPGITGLAQVNGRNTQSWDDRFVDDIAYVDNHSLWLDARILARTAWQVVKRADVAEEGHATRAPFAGEAGPAASD